MDLQIRRVVTGHDETGKSIVKIDDISDNLVSRRPGHSSTVIWTTDTFPSDLMEEGDAALRPCNTAISTGTVFRVARLEPGVAGRMHRTVSIDYAVVLSGEIVMQLDDTEVTLKAGDVLVQRGTIHNWINRGTRPCVVAFVLVGAKPVQIAAKRLEAIG